MDKREPGRDRIPQKTMKQRHKRRKRRRLLRLVARVVTLLCVLLLGVSFIIVIKPRFHDYFPSMLGNVDIVLDAGHGGKDAGANHDNILEKDITLEIAKKTNKILSEAGYKVKMTREKDSFIELADRIDFANKRKPRVYVSIHCNSSEDGNGNGIETFYAESKKENSQKLAESIQKNIVNATGAKDREVKTADYAVILRTDMSAALVEVGFLTDESERALLQKEDYQQKLAEGIAEGVLDFFNTND